MALPSARVQKCLLREATQADLDTTSPVNTTRPTFTRVEAFTGKVPVPVGCLGLEKSIAFHNSKRFALNGGQDAGDRAILVQSVGNLKALLQANLQLEKPITEASLEPGCFGENLLVDENFAANLLCVGDEIECWRGGQVQPLRLQVASPRCPCGKVDERLGKTFSLSGVRAHCAKSGQAGFFLRTLCTGDIQDGDVLKVVKRPHPKWTLARISFLIYGHDTAVMQYLLRSRKAVKDHTTKAVLREEFMGNQEELEELARMKELAIFEWREHLVQMLNWSPIGRYAPKRKLDVTHTAAVAIAATLFAGVVGVLLLRRSSFKGNR